MSCISVFLVLKNLCLSKPHLEVVDEVLMYNWQHPVGKKPLFIVPQALRNDILHHYHNAKTGGHFGRDKTFAAIKSQFFWYRMSSEIELYCQSCNTCIQQKKTLNPRGALQSYHAGAPWERVHIDILGPFSPSSKNNKFILMLVDQFSKWIECYPLPDQKAETVAEPIVREFIARFGCPLQLHSDQGRNFMSDLFSSLCSMLEITKTRTSPYHPSGNGQVERYNKVILQMIRCYSEKKKDWDKDLSLLTGALRATVSRQTGFTPNMIILGQEVVRPVEVMMGMAQLRKLSHSPCEYVKKLQETLLKVHDLASDKLRIAQQRQKKDYDLKIREKSYGSGDYVYVRNDARKVGESRKLQPIYKGPYLVTEQLSPVLYKVRDKKTEKVIHHNRLKACPGQGIPMWMK